MNVAHAVLPLEEYEKMKKQSDDTEKIQKQLDEECLMTGKLKEAIFMILNPHQRMQESPERILQVCGLIITEDHARNRDIKLM